MSNFFKNIYHKSSLKEAFFSFDFGKDHKKEFLLRSQMLSIKEALTSSKTYPQPTLLLNWMSQACETGWFFYSSSIKHQRR